MTKPSDGPIRVPAPGGGAQAFLALPEPLRACAHLLFAEMRQDPELAHVSDDQLMRVICSQAIRPLLTVHARHGAAGPGDTGPAGGDP
jgi:hypothetical protein